MSDNRDITIQYVSQYELNSVDERLSEEIRENRDRIEKNSNKIIELETVYKTLKSLPSTITSLDKTITIISENLKSMDENIRDVREMVTLQEKIVENIRIESKHQNEDIARIDNKSKVDWSEFVTNNFWKIVCGLGAAYCLIEFIVHK